MTPEDRTQEYVRLVGPELAEALPNDGKRWWTKPNLLHLNAVLGICCVSAATLGYDGVLMNALQISPTWKNYYDHPSPARLGAMNAMLPVGKVVGSCGVAPLSNWLGRKKTLIIGFGFAIVGAALQAGSINYPLLVASRLILGIGSAFMSQPSPILIGELAYPTHRGKITALYQTFFFFGAIAAAWISFGTLKMNGDWAWRIPTLLQGALPTLQLLCSYFLPESPRFLVAKGKPEEARQLLVKFHAAGDTSSPLVALEMLQIEEAIRLERDAEKKNLIKVLSNPANRRRLVVVLILAIAAQWSGNTVLSYYLGLVLEAIGITDPTQQSLINGGLQIFNMLAAMFCGAMLVDRLGRKTLFLWSAAGMCISYVVWTALNARFTATSSKAVGMAVLPFLFIFNFHYAIALTPLLYAYPTEIFPYELRGFGVALTLFGANITLIIGSVANPVAMKALGWRYYILFVVIDALFFIAVWFLFPETKGKSLEEVAKVFDKDGDGRLIDAAKVEAVLDEKAVHIEIGETRTEKI
ncbi:general substrate transporter [Corynespora cassiicola Philippines]|uniref:General substrate transporter n=1 Tax=Corynespora cassiicola Philippines TaxID=1448308 RepID=A0A2T2NRA3_CORCC|nr:general substrate transporter [Corynespora cassiicola Philippines]